MKDKIREAEPKDVEGILICIKELAAFERQPDAVVIDQTYLAQYGWGRDKMFDCLVIEVDGEVRAMALFYKRFSTWKGLTLHLEDLIVREPYRGKGYGKALFDKVVQVANEWEVGRMEWEALEWNTPALDFYNKAGTEFDEEWVLCKLSPLAIKKYLVDEGL